MITSRSKVWLLEDSPLEARLAADALEDKCDLELFTEGTAVVERLMVARPDVMVLDWVVPGLSGLEVCRFVRQHHDRLQLPILMLTADARESALVESFEAGASDFVTKPYRPSELAARVEILAGVSRLAIAAEDRHNEEAALLARDAASAESAVLRKDKYIGILGHDLRNPLNAIVVAAKLLGARPADAGRHAERIHRSAGRMALMIRDLLDFARGRFTSGVPIVRVPADLHKICSDVIDELGLVNPERELHLVASGDSTGAWDADRLTQAISNLVGNAIEHGRSIVKLTIVGHPSEVAVTVHNSGPQIPPSEVPDLFEPFRTRDRSGAGLGLGLYIVREIARAHGGDVTVESTSGAGTSFTLTIPRAA